jgi:hypothetical protein
VAVITADLVVTTQPTDVNECVGGTNTMTVTVTGGSGAITYQWQQSSDGSTGWANSTGSGATTATYTPSSTIPGTTYYRVLVNSANNGCDQAVSNNAVAVITADLVISTQPTDVNECVGGTNTMTVTVTGGSGAITYQWQQSADGSTGWANSTGTGATTATYTPSSAVPGTTYYRVLVNSANNGCDQAVSNNAVAVITADLVVTTQPSDVNECVGGTNTNDGNSDWWIRSYHVSVAAKFRRINRLGELHRTVEQQQLPIHHPVQCQEPLIIECWSMQPTTDVTRL